MNTSKAPRVVAALLLAAVTASCSDSTGPTGDPLVITTQQLPDAVIGQAYAGGINAEGGDQQYQWDIVQGQLPPGLALSVEGLTDDDALVQGTPSAEDSAAFTVRVRSGDGQSATQLLSIEVVANPIENVALPPGLVGFPYDVPLRATVVGAQWELAAGTLPAGLSLTDGRITGTPTAPDTVEITVRLVASAVTALKTFELRVVPDQPADYQITPYEVVDVPADIRPHLDAAIAKWESVLTSDMEVGSIAAGEFDANVCGGFGEEVNGTSVDDLLLLVNIESIDGPGKVLGQAGPCLFRDDTLPAVGVLTLDLDDLRPLVGSPTLTYIISHEIGHVLGYGALWDAFGLVDDTTDVNDPRFTGAQAVAEWQALGQAGGVPVETGGGEGTELVHWRESVFGNERMTGYSAPLGVPQPLSRVSVASMADLGYGVDLSAADPFMLPSALQAMGVAGVELWGSIGYDELYDGPVGMLGRDGRGRTIDLR